MWWTLLATLQATTPAGVEGLAVELARTVSEAGLEGPVGIFVEGPEALARATTSLTAAQLHGQKRGPVPIVAPDSASAETIARSQGLHSLLRIVVSVESNQLLARGDAISAWVNFWSGNTPTRSGSAIAIALQVQADAQTLLLVRPPDVKNARLHLELAPWAQLPQRPAAVLLANIEGDERAEVLAVVGHEVWLWKSDGQLAHRLVLSGIRSAHPTREPFGLLWTNNGSIVAWSSHYARPEKFVRDSSQGWRSLGAVQDTEWSNLHLTARPGHPSFFPALQRPTPLTWRAPLTAVSVHSNTLFAVDTEGAAFVSTGQTPLAWVSGVGSGSTLADIDGDGTPEVVVTAFRMERDADEVRVMTLDAFQAAATQHAPFEALSDEWHASFAARAVIATAGPLSAAASDDVIFGAWADDGTGALWLLRNRP